MIWEDQVIIICLFVYIDTYIFAYSSLFEIILKNNKQKFVFYQNNQIIRSQFLWSDN